MTPRLIIASVAALLSAAVPAAAGTTDVMSAPGIARADMISTSVKVDFADLNIANQAGAQALLNRIHAASREVCGARPELFDLAGTQAWESCLDNSVSVAVQTVDSPLLSDLYHARSLGLKYARN